MHMDIPGRTGLYLDIPVIPVDITGIHMDISRIHVDIHG